MPDTYASPVQPHSPPRLPVGDWKKRALGEACGTERYTGAFPTPRISLVEVKTRVPAVSTRVSDVCGQVGTGRVVYRVREGGWYWVGTTPSHPPSTYLAGYIGIARAQPVVYSGYTRPLGHSRPMLDPPHTRAPRAVRYALPGQ